MKITILTLVTDPDKRQDKWREALNNYLDFADEVVVVNGGKKRLSWISLSEDEIRQANKLKQVMLPWPYDWNWAELPKHLNAGLKVCTGNWIIKLDIDQFIHEKDFAELRAKLFTCPNGISVATLQKKSLTFGDKYFEKGGQPIAFRNLSSIAIGEDEDNRTDLCFPIEKTKTKKMTLTDGTIYELPVGKELEVYRTGISYWNFDYFFKDKEFTRKEFWRFSQAYHRYFDKWSFGETEETSFKVFNEMMRGRHKNAQYEIKQLDVLPKHIAHAYDRVTPKQFGYNGWQMDLTL